MNRGLRRLVCQEVLMKPFLQTLAAIAALALAPQAAHADPVVRVSVGLPGIVIAPSPYVVVRPPCPGPAYYWVDSGWRYDSWGRRVYVAGHWAPRVVYRPAPPPPPVHRVVVHH
jgi:hypothetical protein